MKGRGGGDGAWNLTGVNEIPLAILRRELEEPLRFVIYITV